MKFPMLICCMLIITTVNAQITYTFTGNGNWNVASNWQGDSIAPTLLLSGDSILIAAAPGDSCVLNVTQRIEAGAGIRVAEGSHFIIPGKLSILDAGFPTVQIGNQLWQGKNLEVITYRNGDSIPQVTDYDEWNGLSTGAWCYYNNDPTNGNRFGKLYNWAAVNDPRGLAPEGWHVASNDEWYTMLIYLGGTVTAGGPLKATTTWNAPNTGATNASRFTALPGGYRNKNGSFFDSFDFGLWWSSSPRIGYPSAYYALMSSTSAEVIQNTFNNGYGFSVRCVKDQ